MTFDTANVPELGPIRFQFPVPPLDHKTYLLASAQVWKKLRPCMLPDKRALWKRFAIFMLVYVSFIAVIITLNLEASVEVTQGREADTLFQFGTGATVFLIIILMVCGMGLQLLSTRTMQKNLSKWLLANSLNLTSPMELTLAENGLLSRTATGFAVHSWEAITGWFEVNDMQCMILHYNSFYWIPDTLITDKPVFQSFLASKIRPPQA